MRALPLAALALFAGPTLAETTTLPGANTDSRAAYLVSALPDGTLKEKLESCLGKPMHVSELAIGHRGAALMFPEHTAQSYRAAAAQGAGTIECDVTFTKDKQLVCRHAQNDLQTSTNILATDLAKTCAKPFIPASGDTPAAAECLTSSLTETEFLSLKGKMDGGNKAATTVEDYMNGSPRWRTDLYAPGTVLSHKQSIELIKSLGRKFTPELKEASVPMPFDGFTQEMYAQKMIDEYKEAGIAPADVFPQSFHLEDILYWIKNDPEFGKQAVFLFDDETIPGFDNMKPETWKYQPADLAKMGVRYVAPPLFILVTAENGKIVPSAYAKAAKDAGLKIITWSLERSGPLTEAGGGWYYTSINDIAKNDGYVYQLVDVLAREVGVSGIFSDWPATVTFYANCMDMN